MASTLSTETLAVIRHIRARRRHGAGVSPCSDPRCLPLPRRRREPTLNQALEGLVYAICSCRRLLGLAAICRQSARRSADLRRPAPAVTSTASPRLQGGERHG